MDSSKEHTMPTLRQNNIYQILKEKLKYIRRNVTVEPVLAAHMIAVDLARLATENLNLDKACRVSLKYGDKVCDSLIAREENRYLAEEVAVQELVSGIERWKHVLLTAIPSFLILFLGAWSDRTGKRKIYIILPIIGEVVMCLSNILSTYYFYQVPVEVTMFFEAFFPAITGGWITINMGAFSYLAEVSSTETRTFRVGLANLCLTAGGPIGSVLSGILLKHIGYYGVFSLSLLLCLFCIFYGLFYIEDPKMAVTEDIDQQKCSNRGGFIKSFFNIKHVKDTFTMAFKKGPNHRRTKSILLFATLAFIYGPSSGELKISYLFCRYRLNWDAVMFSFYNTIHICTHIFGALISISLFSRYLKWDDSVLGITSNLSKMTAVLITGLARNSMEMYIAVLIETFNATPLTVLRSLSSKLCTSDELGKMTSLFNLMEVVTSMTFGPIYSWIYMVTLQVDTGIVYYISSVLTIPPLVFMWWFFIQHRRNYNKGKMVANSNEEENEAIELKTRNEDDTPSNEYKIFI